MSRHVIDRARLAEVMGIELAEGGHGEGEGRYCIMEAVAYRMLNLSTPAAAGAPR